MDFYLPIFCTAIVFISIVIGAIIGYGEGFEKGKEYYKTDFDFENKK